jgi:histidinol phosphatase-like enzyme
MGSKALQVTLAIQQSEVSLERVILLGDAPGDLRAAEECGIAFYPILPGKESEYWKQFMKEDADLFFAGTYREQREAELIQEYQKLLSEGPPTGL